MIYYFIDEILTNDPDLVEAIEGNFNEMSKVKQILHRKEVISSFVESFKRNNIRAEHLAHISEFVEQSIQVAIQEVYNDKS